MCTVVRRLPFKLLPLAREFIRTKKNDAIVRPLASYITNYNIHAYSVQVYSSVPERATSLGF